MAKEEIRAQLPWQAQGEDPDRGEPHAGVVVEIACGGEFLRPVIKAVDAGLAFAGGLPLLAEARLGLDAVQRLGQALAIGGPDGGATFEPAFPIGPPPEFGEEFVGPLRVGAEGGVDRLGLGQEAVADIGGKARDMGMSGQILVPAGGIGQARAGQEGGKPRGGGGACGGKGKGEGERCHAARGRGAALYGKAGVAWRRIMARRLRPGRGRREAQGARPCGTGLSSSSVGKISSGGGAARAVGGRQPPSRAGGGERQSDRVPLQPPVHATKTLSTVSRLDHVRHKGRPKCAIPSNTT